MFFSFDPAQIFSFLLTLCRVSLVLFMLPFFGGANVPNPVKAALCVVMSLALWPKLSFPGAGFPADMWTIGLMILGELLLGLVLDLSVRVLFAAVQTGGSLIGFQMGFSMINVVDPLTGTSDVITAHFLYMVSLLVFLAVGGHLHLLRGLALSFQIIPPGGLLITPMLTNQILALSGQIFVLGIKVAAPVMVAVFLVDLALALVARAAPQMNVLFIGFPLKISVGFLFLGMLFTVMARHVGSFVISLESLFRQLLQAAVAS